MKRSLSHASSASASALEWNHREWMKNLLSRLVPFARQIANAHDVQSVRGMSGVAFVHNGNDASAHGNEIPVWHFELSTVREVKDERNKRSVQSVPDGIQVQHKPMLNLRWLPHKPPASARHLMRS
jgi:hypothetical protein